MNECHVFDIRKEPASSRVVASMIEEYFTFVASLPGYVTELMNEVRKCFLPPNLAMPLNVL